MIDKAVNYIRSRLDQEPVETGLILGSGLGVIVEDMEEAVEIDYHDIAGFPVSKVKGHAGKLMIGRIGGVYCLVMQGRVHYYEGHTMQQVSYPIRVMQALGIQKLIVTCAAGAADQHHRPGDIMLIDDQINFTFNNPILGMQSDQNSNRFVDSSLVFSHRLKKMAYQVAGTLDIHLKSGVYFFMTVPSYETPAEIKMIHKLGGDMAGMSTFPESLEAHRLGMEVLGLSYISNMGAGLQSSPLHHDEVIQTIESIKIDFRRLIFAIIEAIST